MAKVPGLFAGLLFCAIIWTASVGASPVEPEFGRWTASPPPTLLENLGTFEPNLDASGNVGDIEIIGGIPNFNERIVALRWFGTDGGLCSGYLISSNRVITAAHCLCHVDGTFRDTPPFVSTAADTRALAEASWVKSISAHAFPGWSCQVMLTSLDLAIVKLAQRDENIGDSSNPKKDAHPLRGCGGNGTHFQVGYSHFPSMPSLEELIDARPGSFLVAGYGLQENASGAKSGVRQSAKLGVSSLVCASVSAKNSGCRAFREMILGGSSSTGLAAKDACAGDSGGPVLWRKDGEELLVGVVSRSVNLPPLKPGDKGCLRGGIYTHTGLPVVTSWLKSHGVPTQDTTEPDFIVRTSCTDTE